MRKFLRDRVAPVLLAGIPTMCVFGALFAWTTCDAVTLRQCVQHRPLAECRADVEALP